VILFSSGGKLKKGQTRLFYDLSPTHTHVAVVGVGPREAECEAEEETQENKSHLFRENTRRAAAAATRTLLAGKVKNLHLEDFSEPEGTEVKSRVTVIVSIHVKRGQLEVILGFR